MKIRNRFLYKSDIEGIRGDLHKVRERHNLYANTVESFSFLLQQMDFAENFYPWKNIIAPHLKAKEMLGFDLQRALSSLIRVEKRERAKKADMAEFFGGEERTKIERSVEALRSSRPRIKEAGELILRKAQKNNIGLYITVERRANFLEKLLEHELYLLQGIRSTNLKLAEGGWLSVGVGGIIDVAWKEAKSYFDSGQHEFLIATKSMNNELVLFEIGEQLREETKKINAFNLEMMRLTDLAYRNNSCLAPSLSNYYSDSMQFSDAISKASQKIDAALNSRVQILSNKERYENLVELHEAVKRIPRRLLADRQMAVWYRDHLNSNLEADLAEKIEADIRVRAYDALLPALESAFNATGTIIKAREIGIDLRDQIYSGYIFVKLLSSAALSSWLKMREGTDKRPVQEFSHREDKIIEQSQTTTRE